MRNGLDFSSWQALLPTVLGLAVITLVMVGIRSGGGGGGGGAAGAGLGRAAAGDRGDPAA